MNDIYVTLIGTVAAEPRQHTLTDGTRVTSLRVATNSRYYDRKAQEWRDADKTFFTIRCWRGLGDHVARSVQVGHPVVVQGRLRIREFGKEGERRFIPEVEANSLGHDLRWGIATFHRPPRGATPAPLDDDARTALDTATEDWAFPTTSPTPTPTATPALPPAPALQAPPTTPQLPPAAPSTSPPTPTPPPTPLHDPDATATFRAPAPSTPPAPSAPPTPQAAPAPTAPSSTEPAPTEPAPTEASEPTGRWRRRTPKPAQEPSTETPQAA
ncbi:single-stranded DNA-binding protein [Thermocatellispora tengchongensis]|uniref:Single-stranded DNA-binding protein n=1 Tax=Thermocatellispora tengchongensis TaxID=1073253 RepID=A0A840P4X4_9ACTN|nr:single-stranded DNA-binding protein [Thermocatellispora tengchongensis]MBB5136354.1 single-stranded DNA-binding protein [Thermocatellispora tengchongensis]